MAAKRRLPQAGDIIVVNHENSSETYFFDGKNLVDTVGTMFSDDNVDWNDMWETDKTWRFAKEDERNIYREELKKNNLFINDFTKVIGSIKVIKEYETTEMVKNEDKKTPSVSVNYCRPEGADAPTYKYTITTYPLDSYKDELVRLYDLLEDIEFIAKIGEVESEPISKAKDLFEKIGNMSARRGKNIKTDCCNLFFNNEQLTDYEKENENE